MRRSVCGGRCRAGQEAVVRAVQIDASPTERCDGPRNSPSTIRSSFM